LAALCREHSIDVILAGPVHRLGMVGGGTLDEVGAFVGLVEQVRAALERPLAGAFVHHENKAGTVSGAWEGASDTLAHVVGLGHGATRLEWEKVRWGSSLHGRAWKLVWAEGESFELDETPEVTDEDIRAGVLAAVKAQPGCTAKALEQAVEGNAARIREMRDALLDEGELVNLGGGKGGVGGGGMRLYLADDAPIVPNPDDRSDDRSSPTGEAGKGSDRPSSARKGDEDETIAPHDPPGSDGWCARCERPTVRTGAGQPYCHCQDEADEYAERFGGAS
jgi:hypothetical protein